MPRSPLREDSTAAVPRRSDARKKHSAVTSYSRDNIRRTLYVRMLTPPSGGNGSVWQRKSSFGRVDDRRLSRFSFTFTAVANPNVVSLDEWMAAESRRRRKQGACPVRHAPTPRPRLPYVVVGQ